MAMYKSLLILAFATCVLSDEEKLVEIICSTKDTNCSERLMKKFIEATSNGVPQYGIKPTDPLILSELDYVVDKYVGLVFKFTNINVTGLKNQQITEYRLDRDKRSVALKTKGDFQIIADLNVEFTKQGKSFNGVYTASITAAMSSYYGYTFIKKEDVQYCRIGPETTDAEIIGEPNVTIGQDLQSALDNDADAKDLKPAYESNKVNLQKKTLRKILVDAYATLIQNIRAYTTFMPASAFFTDL